MMFCFFLLFCFSPGLAVLSLIFPMNICSGWTILILFVLLFIGSHILVGILGGLAKMLSFLGT